MHFCVFKSRTIKIIIAMIIAAVLLAINIDGYSSAQVFFGYANKKVPIYAVQTEEKQVAISFDAAWGADKTQGILEILNEYDVKATFFLVGFWVDKYSGMVKTIDENGMEIGTHSNTHPDMTKLDEKTIRSELEISMKKINDITRKDVTLFRPPYGSYNNKLLDVATSLNLKTIQWDVDTLDWKGISAGEISNRVVSNVKNGSIILMHNNSDNILDGLRLTLDRLKKQNYTITSIGELIYNDNYTIDRNGIQHKN